MFTRDWGHDEEHYHDEEHDHFLEYDENHVSEFEKMDQDGNFLPKTLKKKLTCETKVGWLRVAPS